MSRAALDVNELTTKYVTRFGEDVYAVDHVSLQVEEGKSLGIAGESGCGKSTLALSLMGYYFPPLHYTSGEICIDGRNISGMDPDEVRKLILGAEIAYIPQAAMNALNPTQKIIHFIEDVIQEHDLYVTKKDIYERARILFETLGLPARERLANEHLDLCFTIEVILVRRSKERPRGVLRRHPLDAIQPLAEDVVRCGRDVALLPPS